jgi:outer membrane immunogenic protein
MKKFFLGSAALLFLAGAANAADMPVKAMPMKAPPVVMYDWNGFYIGGFYGNSLQETKAHTDPPGVLGGTHAGQVHINDQGITFGGTAGYNWQFDPRWLVGIEADVGDMGVDKTFKDWDDLILTGSKASWYSTLRGRFGYVTGPSLLYVTGGAAWVHVTDTFGGGGVGVLSGPAIANSSTPTGFAVGGGIETKLSRNWSTKTEYLFIDVGSTNFGSNPFGIAGTPTTFDHTYHVIKTGLNYKLDGTWEGLPFFGAPLLPSNHNWQGFYAGINVGGGMSLVRAVNDGVSPGGEENPQGTGLSAGGQVGYNYMLGHTPIGTWFVGLEGDISYLGIHTQVDDWFDTAFARFEADTSWLATARARVGTTTGPALLYMTGGAAWVGLKDGFAPTFAGSGDLASRTGFGYAVGGGTEVAINERWSAKVESLFVDVGHTNHQVFPGGPFYADFKDRFMVVRAGLNLKLGDW